jgi:hypothetical protein
MFGEPFGVGAFVDFSEAQIATQSDFLTDILNRRRLNYSRGDCVWFLEKHGAHIVQPTAFEPDPETHRSDYYYNAIENVLYRKNKATDKNVWVRMR